MPEGAPAGTFRGTKRPPLVIVTGRAGSGKTRRCLSAVVADLRAGGPWKGPPLLLLVPEQATALTERILLDALGGPGAAYSRARVVSFRWLAQCVLSEAGGAPRPALDTLGKQMLLRRVIDRMTAESGPGYFGASARRPGFLAALHQTLDEFRRYRIEPASLEASAAEARAAGDAACAQRLEELARLDRVFRAQLDEQFTDPEDYLTLAASRLGRCTIVRGARIWIDGFTGFTPQEYLFLRALFAYAGPVELELCLDRELAAQLARNPAETTATSVCDPTARTFLRLIDTAEEASRETRWVGLDDPSRFDGEPALSTLERRLAERTREPVPAAPAIRFVEAPDRRGEVEAAALECLRLCRERGLRFRDVAVLVRDIEPYADLITSTFREMGIPVFIDRRRALAHHPLVELVRCALEVVKTRWSAEAVFRYLRTDLVTSVTRDEVDLLERHARAHGLRGEVFTSDAAWRHRRARFLDEEEELSPEDDLLLRRLDAVRRAALDPLAGFDRAVRLGEPLAVEGYCRHLYEHVRAIQVPETLARWSEAPARPDETVAERIEREIRARSHRQAWDGFLDLLDQMVDALGNERLPLDEYSEALGAGLEALTEALPPPVLDQVLVGSLERSRHPELRAAFVLGLNDRVFPRVRESHPVLRDTERRRLADSGLEVGPTREIELYQERYFLYIAATRATEHVSFSLARLDERARPLAPSSFWSDLRAVCPEAPAAHPSLSLGNPANAVTPIRLASAIAAGVRSGDPARRTEALSLYAAACASPVIRPVFERVLPGFRDWQNGSLSPEAVRGLYGATLRLSASKLQDFGRCPFRFFAKYGLGLEEMKTHELATLDLGAFYHAVLRGYAERMKAQGLAWKDSDAATRHAAVAEALEEVAPRIRGEAFLKSPRNRHFLELIRRELSVLVDYLAAACRETSFEPSAFELGFGLGDEKRPPLSLRLPDGREVLLVGKIDRVDLVRDGDRLVALALDYKTGKMEFDPALAIEGIDLQLLTYLVALKRLGRTWFGCDVIPAGAAYQKIRVAMRKAPPVNDEPQEATADFHAKLAREGQAARGLFGREWISHVDRGWERGDPSDFVRTAKGTKGREPLPSVLAAGRLDAVIARAEERIIGWAGAILGGRYAAQPFRSKEKTACDLCEFSAVCGFDRELHDFHTIARMSPERAFAAMAGADGEAAADGETLDSGEAGEDPA